MPVDETGVAEGNSWEFRLSPYAWFAGFKGDVATLPSLGAAPVPIEISPSDALSDTESSLAMVLEGKKERHGFLVDYLFSDMRTYNPLLESINLSLDSVSKTTLFSAAYMYEIYKHQGSVVDAYLGARYWEIDTKLRFSGGLGVLHGRDLQHAESWIDPILGVKGRTALGETNFYAAASASVGGFGIGSDLFYDLSAHLGYQWSRSIGTTIGYRMYDLDYENDGFTYDVRQEGAIIGLTWAF